MKPNMKPDMKPDHMPSYCHPTKRPRRLRRTQAMRDLVQETHLHPSQLVLPLFIQEGQNLKTPISSLPSQYRLSIDHAILTAKQAWELGIRAVALFPVIPPELKNSQATEALNEHNLLIRAVTQMKSAIPDMLLITDIALDPYSSEGHDGLVQNGVILNDETVHILAKMAVLHAKAGADIVAPSDMMDGRIKAIRRQLDAHHFQDTAILSYASKFASHLYGPFRDALDSAPKSGDKKTYQLNPANRQEALLEAELDAKEGADILMVKPATYYLDIIRELTERRLGPIAAYHVSGEYSVCHLLAKQTGTDPLLLLMEAVTSIKRAGASIIFTYAALDIARYLKEH